MKKEDFIGHFFTLYIYIFVSSYIYYSLIADSNYSIELASITYFLATSFIFTWYMFKTTPRVLSFSKSRGYYYLPFILYPSILALGLISSHLLFGAITNANI